MKLFWTADRHFNHANIIKYCKRPFDCVKKMNRTIIKGHNDRVKDEDTVFDLGDFCFRNSPGGKAGEGLPQKAEFFQKQLKGNIIHVKGNHDRNNSLKTCIERIIIRYGGYRICMVHNPIHADPNYELNFVGHIHEKWKFKKLGDKSFMVNVGVDVWNFRPVGFEEIMKELRKWKKKNVETKTDQDANLSKREKKEV